MSESLTTATSSTDSSNYCEELKKSLKVLNDFGIKTRYIPNGYFANLNSQRDLDMRVQELIAKKLTMA